MYVSCSIAVVGVCLPLCCGTLKLLVRYTTKYIHDYDVVAYSTLRLCIFTVHWDPGVSIRFSVYLSGLKLVPNAAAAVAVAAAAAMRHI